MNTVEEIGKIVDWYFTQYAGAPIEQYMDAKSKLRGLLFRFAGEVADAKAEHVQAVVCRKTDFHGHKVRLVDEGHTLGQAESKAELAIKAQRQREAQAESLFFKQKQLYDAADEIANDIAQRISILKKERENA